MAKTGSQRRSQALVRKPKQDRARNTVAVLLEAAARVLAERGWVGFNTNVVATRAGVSIGSLYEYFPNKQALVDAVAIEHLAKGEAMLEQSQADDRSSMTLEQFLHALVQGFIKIHRDDPELHRALSGTVPLSPHVTARAQKLLEATVMRVEHHLSGVVRQPKIVATLLVETTDAVVHRWVIDHDGKPLSDRSLSMELERMLGAYLRSLIEPGM
jgi:AcrR family transcriptional regulator